MGFLSEFSKVGFVENYGLRSGFLSGVLKVGFVEKYGLNLPFYEALQNHSEVVYNEKWIFW